MFAAAVGIQAVVKSNVRTGVVADNRAGVIIDHLSRDTGFAATNPFLRIGLKIDSIETANGVFTDSATSRC